MPRAWFAGSMSLRFAATGVVAALLIVLSLAPVPFGAYHVFAIFSVGLALLSVHLAYRLEQLQDLQRELTENEARYRALLDAQDDMILRRDGAGNLTFANKAFMEMFGVTPGDVLNKPFRLQVRQGASNAPLSTMGNVRHQQFTQLVETAIGPRWIEWEDQLVPAADGSNFEVQSIGRDVTRDITEERQTKAWLLVACDQAEAANRAKSRFLATMSHELRTPLNAILGFSEVMNSEVMGPMANRAYKEYAGNIFESGHHLLHLINEILDLSRIESGRYELHEEPLRLVESVDECHRLMKLKLESKGLEVVEDFAPDLPLVWADPRAIRQVCLNLMSNALKFTPKGGRITLTVGPTDSGGQFVSVRDSGPGIPEDEIPKVMQPFGQGTLAHQSAEGGAGLGLPIVQNLVELHGGKFSLQSELRKGTTAIVELSPHRVLQTMAPLQPLGQETHRLKEPAQRPPRTAATDAGRTLCG